MMHDKAQTSSVFNSKKEYGLNSFTEPRPVPSIILLSGGLDSAANLAFFAMSAGKDIENKREILSQSYCLTINYGQMAAEQELRVASSLAKFYQTQWMSVELPWLGAMGGSSLTDSSQKIPQFQNHQLDDLEITNESARSVWVPNRNGVFIEVAAAFADRLGIQQILVGFNAEEASTFPDNSKAYLESINLALEYSTASSVRVSSFTTDDSKIEIVQKLKSKCPEFSFSNLWPCYRAGQAWCNECESCRRFHRAQNTAADSLATRLDSKL